MSKDIDYDFLDIDEHHLDREWGKQARTYFEWADKLANARMKWDQAKAARDVVRAETYQKIKSKPENYDLPKVTESAVEMLVTLQDAVQEAEQAIITAKHDMDVLQAVVEALEHKKKALEMRVHLYISGWHAEPRTPKGATQDDVDKVTTPRNSRAYKR